MDIRQPIHSEHARTLDTEGLRRHFLVQDLFQPDQATLTYSQIDRIIVGGIMPVGQAVRFAPELGKHTGTDFFLQRRELGLINIGGAARVSVDELVFEIGPREALYVGQGARELAFSSVDPAQPAKLYFNCAPAHTAYPHRKVTLAEASPMRATFGKRLFGLRVCGLTGGPLTFSQTVIRNFSKLVSLLPCGLGFLWAILSHNNRAWHDLFAKAVVIEERY